MDCRTPESCKFKRKLGFKLHDVINTKHQTIIRSIKEAFEGENMQSECSVLNTCRVNTVNTELIIIFMITSLQ